MRTEPLPEIDDQVAQFARNELQLMLEANQRLLTSQQPDRATNEGEPHQGKA